MSINQPAQVAIRVDSYMQVYWQAVLEQGSGEVSSDDLDLTTELTFTSSKAQCAANERFCLFAIPLQQDSVPENQTTFYVELRRTSSGAEIDAARKYAQVVMRASDHPNGLLEFADASRYVYVNTVATIARLIVHRRGHSQKRLRVNFRTEPFTDKQTIGGLVVYHALPGADFTRVSGQLTFDPGVNSLTIDIQLDPTKASTNPYPKVFKVVLDEVDNGGELGEAVAMVTITEQQSQIIWSVWAQTQRVLHNDTIDRSVTQYCIKVSVLSYLSWC